MTAFRTVLTGLFLLMAGSSVAQNSIPDGVYYQDKVLRISTSVADCVNKSNGTAKAYIIIEAENLSDSDIILSLRKNLWYDGNCGNCNSTSKEHQIELNLGAGETIKGSCTENNGLRIFQKMIDLKNVRQLTHFELKDIKAAKL